MRKTAQWQPSKGSTQVSQNIQIVLKDLFTTSDTVRQLGVSHFRLNWFRKDLQLNLEIKAVSQLDGNDTPTHFNDFRILPVLKNQKKKEAGLLEMLAASSEVYKQ